MKNILLISFSQFGYHTDMYKYYTYLKKHYKVTYLCTNNNLPKIDSDLDDVIYLETCDRSILKINFIREIRNFLQKTYYHYVIADYFIGCSMIKNPNSQFIMDIRSETINNNRFKKVIRDSLIKLESNFFDKILVISEGLRNNLNIANEDSCILPLGADIQVENTDAFGKDFNVIYVGTLDNRNIINTVKGFKLFNDKYNIVCKYNIIGYSNSGEDINLKKYIKDNNINNTEFLGRINNSDLGTYFENSTIGMSYIPITEYFDHQPPTKTFEYICNGLICLATKTFANSQIINSSNGVLTGETSEEVFKGLEYIYLNLNKYNKKDIIENSKKYSWENIVENKLIPYLEIKK